MKTKAMSNLATTDNSAELYSQYSDAQGQGRRGASGRHRSSRSPERQAMYTQQQMDQQRRRQPQPQQHHHQQKYPGQYPPQQHYGGGGVPAGRGHPQASPMAPTTGQFRSGHLEVQTLYGQGGSGQLTVNSMNAPNNSTVQCGCENIDCPFCNLMTSVQMSS